MSITGEIGHMIEEQDNGQVKTVSDFAPISTIPENKIRSSNVVEVYGVLLQAYQRLSHAPARMVFTDLTAYQDYTVETREPLDPEIAGKLNTREICTVTLNQSQKSKLVENLQKKFGYKFAFEDSAQGRCLDKLGVLVKIQFYLKNYKDHLEGLCISFEFVDEVTKLDETAVSLMERIRERLGVKRFHRNSPITKYFQPEQRIRGEDLLFKPTKRQRVEKIRDSRFDTQAILFNANRPHHDDDDDDDDIFSSDSDEEIEEESFISIITAISDLQSMAPAQDVGKSFKLSGYLIKFERGLQDEVIFVESSGLTSLNETNSIILKHSHGDSLKYGQRLEIGVVKQLQTVGSLKLANFLIVK